MTLALIAVAMLAACGERVQNAPQPGDNIQLPPMEWRIVSEPEMRRVYADAGMPLERGQKLHGFVGTQSGRAVIYTTAPSTVDDQVATTLGHEIMHVALGSYHE